MGMTHIVDRRLNGKNKSAVNRERFLRRYRHHIKKAVSDAVHQRSITDIERGESVSIPTRDVDEPVFHHGQGGNREMVHPVTRSLWRATGCPSQKVAMVGATDKVRPAKMAKAWMNLPFRSLR